MRNSSKVMSKHVYHINLLSDAPFTLEKLLLFCMIFILFTNLKYYMNRIYKIGMYFSFFCIK